MLYEDFYSQFIDSYNEGDNDAASLALMRELGNILVKKREDFVYLLNESEIPATTEMSGKAHNLHWVLPFWQILKMHKQVLTGKSK